MNLKEYLNEKGILIDEEIISSKGKKHYLTELIEGFNTVSNWEQRKSESLSRANFKMNWNSEKIKQFRNLVGLSQNEFAELIGIHQATLSLIEKGRELKDIDTINKLSSVLEDYKNKRINHLKNEINFLKSF